MEKIAEESTEVKPPEKSETTQEKSAKKTEKPKKKIPEKSEKKDSEKLEKKSENKPTEKGKNPRSRSISSSQSRSSSSSSSSTTSSSASSTSSSRSRSYSRGRRQSGERYRKSSSKSRGRLQNSGSYHRSRSRSTDRGSGRRRRSWSRSRDEYLEKRGASMLWSRDGAAFRRKPKDWSRSRDDEKKLAKPKAADKPSDSKQKNPKNIPTSGKVLKAPAMPDKDDKKMMVTDAKKVDDGSKTENSTKAKTQQSNVTPAEAEVKEIDSTASACYTAAISVPSADAAVKKPNILQDIYEEKQRSAFELAISMYLSANEYYDGGNLWCRLCQRLFTDIPELCRHIHSDQHQLVSQDVFHHNICFKFVI